MLLAVVLTSHSWQVLVEAHRLLRPCLLRDLGKQARLLGRRSCLRRDAHSRIRFHGEARLLRVELGRLDARVRHHLRGRWGNPVPSGLFTRSLNVARDERGRLLFHLEAVGMNIALHDHGMLERRSIGVVKRVLWL